MRTIQESKKLAAYHYVPKNEVVRHIKKLIKNHRMTQDGIARAAGVTSLTIYRILHGVNKKVRSTTANKILGVCASDKSRHALPNTLIKSNKTLRLIEEIHAAGFSYRWIIRETGITRLHGIKKYKYAVTAQTAMRVKRLHDKLWEENTPGFYVHGGGPHNNKVVYSGKTLRNTCICYDSIIKNHKRVYVKRDNYGHSKSLVGAGL